MNSTPPEPAPETRDRPSVIDLLAWSKRHGFDASLADTRAAFEDAATSEFAKANENHELAKQLSNKTANLVHADNKIAELQDYIRSSAPAPTLADAAAREIKIIATPARCQRCGVIVDQPTTKQTLDKCRSCDGLMITVTDESSKLSAAFVRVEKAFFANALESSDLSKLKREIDATRHPYAPAPSPGWIDPVDAATMFHDTYERLAPSFGYETRKDTKKFDTSTPNGKLMIAVCGEVLRHLSGHQQAAGVDSLLAHCKKFIAEQEIICAESCHQTDRVSENASIFIEGVCEIVGYHKTANEGDDL